MPEKINKKIGVYTACNNAKYLERSLFSVSTADYIVAIVSEDNEEAKKILDNLSMMLPQLTYFIVKDKELVNGETCAKIYIPADVKVKIPLIDGDIFPADWREQVEASEEIDDIKSHIQGINNLLPLIVPYKIAVYAISGNELSNIDDWWKSMEEADYICVLDTGSTDGSWEKWQEYKEKYPKKLIIARKTYNPGRFDTPRNDSMKLIPDDTDICISTDLDERLTPTWANHLRAAWHPGCQRGYYLYAWSHLPNGSPARVFGYDKVHVNSGLGQGKFPVHEALWHPVYHHSDLQKSQIAQISDDFVMLHHYPDRTKPRSNYLDLLKMRFAELPNDLYTVTYLAHEFTYQKQWQEGIDFIEKVAIPSYETMKPPLVFGGALYRFLGQDYIQLKELDKAEVAFKKGIEKDPIYRDNYLQLAKVYYLRKQYEDCIRVVNEGLIKSRKRNSWLEGDLAWNYEPGDILGAAYASMGAYHTALHYIQLALVINPNDQVLKKNYELLYNQVEHYDFKE